MFEVVSVRVNDGHWEEDRIIFGFPDDRLICPEFISTAGGYEVVMVTPPVFSVS